ncbi:hypothetical protein HMPREF9440_00427 [Sutterella parvirubra YIT 11816]|uniref:Uncharacterized protein n=1 Tax=Sutterella parvirubra YIT 11816 TaxID=762967 RepID=H3KCH5_9BURK|nr:hypothetical protein HMPREF9440_00427 [Sutterella parvirubra YIT 11816]
MGVQPQDAGRKVRAEPLKCRVPRRPSRGAPLLFWNVVRGPRRRTRTSFYRLRP